MHLIGGEGSVGETAIRDSEVSRIYLYGAQGGPGTGVERDRVRIEGDGANGRLVLGGDGVPGSLVIENGIGERSLELAAGKAFKFGGNSSGEGNRIIVQDSNKETTIDLDAEREIGLVAQDVDDVVPEVVDRPTDDGYYGIDYGKLVPVLVNAIAQQEDDRERLSERVDRQQAVIDDLEQRVAALEARD
ncbi:hypothetical protein BRC81_06510 [Halobacteriales archaeon QS_1_68_20]|nr:MAG: hypothetical protein BRC81_06510 [Halobacteriales archaeon QS_1_68_20]